MCNRIDKKVRNREIRQKSIRCKDIHTYTKHINASTSKTSK